MLCQIIQIGKWGSKELASPSHKDEHLQALRLAYRIYTRAIQRHEKYTFARHIAGYGVNSERWLRKLQLEIKRLSQN